MTSPKIEHPVPTMTVETATHYARGIHSLVAGNARDEDDAEWRYAQFENSYSVGRWTVEHLRKGKAKTCDVGVFARLKAAYLDLCARQVSRLQHEIAISKATDDDLDDLEAEAAALAAKIAAKKAAMRLARATPQPPEVED